MSLLLINVTALVFAIAGLAFAGWGVATLVRRKPAAGAALRVGMGLVLLGCAGWLLWRYGQAPRLLFAQDYEADPGRLEELRRADLARPEERADTLAEW